MLGCGFLIVEQQRCQKSSDVPFQAFASISVFYVRQKPVAELPEMRLEINTPSTPAPLEFALSPDGRYIVFVASGNGPQRLWLCALDKTDAQPMTGTEGGDYPFWSPDSRSIAAGSAWKLVCLTHNILKLFRSGRRLQTAAA